MTFQKSWKKEPEQLEHFWKDRNIILRYAVSIYIKQFLQIFYMNKNQLHRKVPNFTFPPTVERASQLRSSRIWFWMTSNAINEWNFRNKQFLFISTVSTGNPFIDPLFYKLKHNLNQHIQVLLTSMKTDFHQRMRLPYRLRRTHLPHYIANLLSANVQISVSTEVQASVTLSPGIPGPCGRFSQYDASLRNAAPSMCFL
jgi:hypothetical protein